MNKPTCAVPECSTRAFRRGHCSKHYRQLPRLNVLTTAEKMDARTNKTPTCWLWTSYKQTSGYGMVQVDGVGKVAHRAAYELAYGPIPDGMQIDHICHVRHCVRPEHLRPVTHKQNSENFGGLEASNTSGYRGVDWHNQRRKWRVRVGHNGHYYSGGLHADIEEANAAAIALRKKLHTHNDLDRYETVKV